MTVIRHTVAFALPFDAGSSGELEFLTEARRLATIPVVRAFQVLRSLDERAALPLTLSMEFTDRAAYDEYDGHPLHREFVERRWLPTVTAFQEADYAVEPS